MPDADRRDHAPDLFVGEHFILAGLEGVDDFASQRKNGLVFADAAAFGASAGGITLDQVEFAFIDVACS